MLDVKNFEFDGNWTRTRVPTVEGVDMQVMPDPGVRLALARDHADGLRRSARSRSLWFSRRRRREPDTTIDIRRLVASAERSTGALDAQPAGRAPRAHAPGSG
jgi:hypothetical protein